MAFSRTSKQTYFGRVTGPAQPKDVKGKPVLEFSLAIDRAIDYKKADGSYDRKTLFIKCSYSPRGDQPALDPVVAILTRISTKEKQDNTLSGAIYNSVEVIVEGTESFYESAEGRLFKNLKYCEVQVTDGNLLKAFYSFKQAATGQTSNGANFQQVAPQQSYVAPQQHQQAVAPQVQSYTIGTIQNIGGTLHQLVGNDPSLRENWVPGQVVNGQFVPISSQQSLVAQSTVNTVPTPQAPAQFQAPHSGVPVAPVSPTSAVKSALTTGLNSGFVVAPPAFPGMAS